MDDNGSREFLTPECDGGPVQGGKLFKIYGSRTFTSDSSNPRKFEIKSSLLSSPYVRVTERLKIKVMYCNMQILWRYRTISHKFAVYVKC